MVFDFDLVRQADPKVYELAVSEAKKQVEQIRLIPSENYASAAVLQALCTPFSNKYSEGYAGKRYYEGQEFIDELETLTIERAKAVFGADHANVQPYSGSPANLAVYFALLKPGDKVMGLDLPSGGHLTHGARVSITGTYYESHPYVGNEDGWLDYDRIREQALQVRPKLLIAGGTAYPRVWDFEKLAAIAREVDAYFVADIAHINGLIIGKVHPDPVPHADVVSSTTHKMLRGPRGGLILCKDAPLKGVEGADAEKRLNRLPGRLDRAVFPGLQGGPHENQIAALAIALDEAARPAYTEYAQQIVKNAKALAEGLLARGFHLVTGGTDNHLLLIDMLKGRGIPGWRFAKVLYEANIEVNANSVPNDPLTPLKPAGIRIGTPAITTRGMKEAEMELVARWMGEVADAMDGENVVKPQEIARIRGEVLEVTRSGRFPVPGIEC
ncbi:MAG: serine hydroxymethyltransferase [Armatimonadota bacterium]